MTLYENYKDILGAIINKELIIDGKKLNDIKILIVDGSNKGYLEYQHAIELLEVVKSLSKMYDDINKYNNLNVQCYEVDEKGNVVSFDTILPISVEIGERPLNRPEGSDYNRNGRFYSNPFSYIYNPFRFGGDINNFNEMNNVFYNTASQVFNNINTVDWRGDL